MSTELKDAEVMVHDSAGNVFVDLGLPSTPKDLLKVAIAREITNTLLKKKLTQVDAAKLIGIDQAKVSALMRGRLKGFSVERLINILVMLGRDVNINIPQVYKDEPGTIQVNAA